MKLPLIELHKELWNATELDSRENLHDRIAEEEEKFPDLTLAAMYGREVWVCIVEKKINLGKAFLRKATDHYYDADDSPDLEVGRMLLKAGNYFVQKLTNQRNYRRGSGIHDN